MSTDEMIEGREIADLLPFYAAGTLSVGERARVAAALADDPALRRELMLVEEERHTTIEVNEALGAPSRAATQRLFAMLDNAAPKAAPARFDVGAWLAAKFEGLRPRTMAYAAGFACLVLVAQAGIIGTMMSSRSGGGFETASVEPAAASGTIVVVAFAPTARAGDIAKLLEEMKASIVSGPSGGLYQLRIADKLLSTAERDKALERLKAQQALIRFVAPATSGAD